MDTAEIQSEADAIRGSVVPPAPFSFTLTGRSGDIELQLGNTSDDPLTVILRASSPKLSFPGVDRTDRRSTRRRRRRPDSSRCGRTTRPP